ncbi:histidine phosphatase family protein [Sinisalibacter lacisalsi]|uniref:Phosphoglycerate mutase n=1 Tax=Sinisalibacter lacisalsi TaxID=1526570 RepID=A0ABQ1QNF9_9RHOB|nr:histidine phosphatase family protein [Sinisalibacter lacisalsi]GGD32372.1 phosphoglycerate mutase [Sinisalibacter lacisalsi]
MRNPELWILRHGQTEWNAEGRKQGGRDSPLTALGRSQAADQNRILRRTDLPDRTTFQVSPQGRATAAIALDGIAVPVVDDRLREIELGDFEGKTDAELRAGWPDIMDRDDPLPWHFHAPGGETWGAFNARIADWLADQRAPAVIVAHGMLSAVLRGQVLGLDIAGISRLPGGQGIVWHIRDGVMTRLEA